MRVVVKCSATASFGLAAGVLLASAVVLISGSALADGSVGQEIRVPAAVVASSNCPKNIAVRYPWIACRTTAMGTQVIAGPVGDDTWESKRATPGDDPFVNQGGFFGPVANR
jgi:hypothetical protein